jgi:hypothetical protein
VCGPCRSCLQTGQYATTTGVWKNGPGLKPDAPKLAELLDASGYRTSYFGKWHLSEQAGSGPVPDEDRAGYQDWLAANLVELVTGPYSARLWNENNQEVPLHGYRVDAQTDAMLDYLRERASDSEGDQKPKPFFCFHSFLEPHHQNTDDSYPAPRGMEEAYRQAPLPPDLAALGGSREMGSGRYIDKNEDLDRRRGCHGSHVLNIRGHITMSCVVVIGVRRYFMVMRIVNALRPNLPSFCWLTWKMSGLNPRRSGKWTRGAIEVGPVHAPRDGYPGNATAGDYESVRLWLRASSPSSRVPLPKAGEADGEISMKAKE